MEETDLTNDEINRYSRQMMLSDFGSAGQLKLKNASVLIVGAGGLGCPSSLYLAGAGIGHIGLVDNDVVELSNLHRQILHKESAVDKKKVQSASSALQDLNSGIKVSEYHVKLSSINAKEIVCLYDVVVDASDNVATKYLLNDVCFLCQKPLVSGSALQMEGQLTVFHYQNAPCYRCLFPKPPPPQAVTNCGEGGVLGVIPGTIGVLQALQVINILLNKTTLAGIFLLFDGSDCSFRRVKLRNRRKDCELCGENPLIKTLIDYEQFCQGIMNIKLLESNQRISVTEFCELKVSPHLLVDVRSAQEFAICNLPGSINIPIRLIEAGKADDAIQTHLDKLPKSAPVFVICRRGNDSQKAVLALKDKLAQSMVKDIIGGLHAWTKDVDPHFPVY